MTDKATTSVLVEQPKTIWNPNATSNWSLLFTPAFGSWLQMLNWQSLGETELASHSRRWFYATGVVLLLTVFSSAVINNPDTASAVSKAIYIPFLLAWYFLSGRPQAQYVKQRFGDAYNRRKWTKPLLFATGIAVLWLGTQVLLAMLFAGSSAT